MLIGEGDHRTGEHVLRQARPFSRISRALIARAAGRRVVGYGAASWARRRRPLTSEWKPLAGDRIRGGRAAMVMGLAGILCGLFVLLDPRWVLDFFWDGRAAPAAYEALTYTDTFLRRQAPVLLALLFRTIDTVKLFDSVYVITQGGPGDLTETLSLNAYNVVRRLRHGPHFERLLRENTR